MTRLYSDLSQLLGRCRNTPYFRQYSNLLQSDAGDRNVFDYLLEEGFKAYTLDQMPAKLRSFLQCCDRSLEIQYELFKGKPLSTEEEMDSQVIARMNEEKTSKSSPDPLEAS